MSEISTPLLLRRRLSVPEIVMRKYSLAQKVNDEDDDGSLMITGRKSSSMSRKKKKNYRRVNLWRNSNFENEKMKVENNLSQMTELNVISNVRLSQPTLDLIFREILKEAKLNFVNESTFHESEKKVISSVDVGSPYKNTSQTSVPRYSATPRTSSMEVNASSSGNDNGSDSDTFLDSLEDLSNVLLPDNSDQNKALNKSKSKPCPAFFVPIENKATTPTKKISDLLPNRVKEKLFARQEKRQKKLENPVSTLPRVPIDPRPTGNSTIPIEPTGTKRFIVKPKKFNFPKRKQSPKRKPLTIVSNDNKSKIPISMTPNLPKIVDEKPKRTTKIPVSRRNMDTKVDRLIANILIDTLNRGIEETQPISKKETNSSVPQGWSSLYMLHKHPESPESTSDEGTHNSRKITTKKYNDRTQSPPINEWSVTVEGSYVPDIEMRLRFHRMDHRRKIEQKNNVRLPAMRFPPSSINNERWSEMTGVSDFLRSKGDERPSKVNSTKHRRDVLPKNRQLQPVRGLESVLGESQLSAILRKFPGLLTVNGNGILPDKNHL
ncbi:uncharacterized protein [Onthophagus taurus]|uniref:uncharacterized protein isoform X1 n=1 Tax=Onthophagus taurus TaxID=166361 RepID=UPI0039BDDBA2